MFCRRTTKQDRSQFLLFCGHKERPLPPRMVSWLWLTLFFWNDPNILSESFATKPSPTDPTLGTSISIMADYSSLIRKLYNYNILHPVKMGLENSQRLYKLFGRPLDGIPIVHVAGTNGKGSVSLKTAECLRRGGLRTGLFVSPHISSFRERIQVNGVSAAEETVLELLPKVFEMCETHKIPATFFELTCSLAFVAFQRAQCEAIVLEVGLGGRLDSTNVITPNLSIITSIQLDHTKILGDTIEKIAMEKAGIMKPGVDVLVGPGCPIEFLRAEAGRIGAPFYTLSDVLQPDEITYKVPQTEDEFADIDQLNTDIARAALRLLKQSAEVSSCSSSSNSNSKLLQCLSTVGMEDGLKLRPPCRFEIIPQSVNLGGVSVTVDVVLDIAHNEDAMVALLRKVDGLYHSPIHESENNNLDHFARGIRVVLGMSSDKDIYKCLAPVLRMTRGHANQIYCVAAKHPRAIVPKELRELISKHSMTLPHTINDIPGAITSVNGDTTNHGTIVDDMSTTVKSHIPGNSGDMTIRESIADAIRSVAEQFVTKRPHHRPVVIVCGSAFIMAEARAALGIVEPKDGDTLSDAIAMATSGISSSSSDSNDQKVTIQNFSDAQEYFSDSKNQSSGAI